MLLETGAGPGADEHPADEYGKFYWLGWFYWFNWLTELTEVTE